MRLLGTLCVLTFSQVALGQSTGTTVGGFPACTAETYLDDVMTFAVKKDLASMEAYLDAGYCLVVKGGVPVQIVSISLSRVKFDYSGVELWTVREGVRRP